MEREVALEVPQGADSTPALSVPYVTRSGRIENPLVTLRNDARLTVDGIARRAGVGRQVVMRTEQGVFTDPPDSILDTLLALSPDTDKAGVLAAYYAYQRDVRRYNFGRLDTDVDFNIWAHTEVSDHPFVWWRCNSGIVARIQVSKLYCVHPAVMFKFEMQPWLMKSLPQQLEDALLESGYSEAVLTNLASAYRIYRGYLSSKVRSDNLPHTNRQTA